MPRPVPGASQLAPCPLRSRAAAGTPSMHPVWRDGAELMLGEVGTRPKHLVWRDETGWVAACGTPRVWLLIAAGLPCWHLAIDAANRRWIPSAPGGPGWTDPVFRPNRPLEVAGGQVVCDVCHGDLTGGG